MLLWNAEVVRGTEVELSLEEVELGLGAGKDEEGRSGGVGGRAG